MVEELVAYNCVDIACGNGHTIALMDTGEAFSWGKGSNGELGLGSAKNYDLPQRITCNSTKPICFTSVSCGSKHSALLSGFGQVYAFGNNE